MWFDVQKALAEVDGGRPRVSKQFGPAPSAAEINSSVAVVASFATPPVEKLAIEHPARDEGPIGDRFPHGLSFGGQPRTWTGRIVVLAEWRQLDEWDRHGPRGKHWNGLTRQWETPKGDTV